MDKKETTKEIVFDGKYHYGLGRRKTAVAKVRLYKGSGKLYVNQKEDYFGGLEGLVKKILSPLTITGNQTKFDISAITNGGGISSQADAITLGVARALVAMEDELKPTLRKAGFLTRDPRKKERKKPGLRRARKAPQFSKR
uniref:Small ribosomal subunit protein uS9 n=1 Tax=candidate division CPR3 bacterium TaxID=2268181 RepID=A0A7C4R5Q0_UNCC3